MAERRTQKAGSLSGGQQQMLAIARALMSGPRLLLVDEASLGLSPLVTETAFDFIASANKQAGVAVLIVEQNVLALDLARRAYVLEKGQVVDVAEGQAVRAMQGRLRDAYLGKATHDRGRLRPDRRRPAVRRRRCLSHSQPFNDPEVSP